MKKMMTLSFSMFLVSCSLAPITPSERHIQAEPPTEGSIPQTVQKSLLLPVPKPAAKVATYSVMVRNVPAQELLFALARDAKINIDIHPGVSGVVTLNAIEQSLPQILNRISKQVDMRYEVDGPNLTIMPDTPYLYNYKIDYINMSRETSGSVSINTQISSTGSVAIQGQGSTSSGMNTSSTAVSNQARSRFWETLVKNIKDILHETDKILPEGSSETTVSQSAIQSTTGTGAPSSKAAGKSAEASIAASPNPATLQGAGTTVIKRTTFREAASVIDNPESGIISIRATMRQHEKIQEFIDKVMQSAKRQVLIEATIVEVQLSDKYQQGINWSRLRLGGKGWSLTQAPVGVIPSAVNQSLFVLNYTNPTSSAGNISATISLLESFGKVKVLSSPQLSVLNNQTALLKVVDNRIYFTITGSISQGAAGTANLQSFTTTINSVPIGFVMNVTPQISSNDSVIINLRPTISRILGFVSDPNPSLPAGVQNLIPEIQTREMESVIRISSGQIAVMGGLMQDSMNNVDDAVPGVSKIQGIGNLFMHKNDSTTKSELVIFLRPTVIKDASLDGDFARFRNSLPNDDFFNEEGQ